jgi:hypothetical protein
MMQDNNKTDTRSPLDPLARLWARWKRSAWRWVDPDEQPAAPERAEEIDLSDDEERALDAAWEQFWAKRDRLDG